MNSLGVLVRESRLIGWFKKGPKKDPLFSESRIFRFFGTPLQQFPPLKQFLPGSRAFQIAPWLLVLLLFFLMFIPRIPVMTLQAAYQVDLRSEDIFLVLLILIVFGGILAGRRLKGVPSVERSFLFFLVAAGISILSGLWLRTIDKPFLSLLVLLKWTEYFLTFGITYRLVRNAKDSNFLLTSFFWLGTLVALYGVREHFFSFSQAAYPNYYRLYERFPFHGDANHIGGFLVIWMAFLGGCFLTARDRRRSLIFLGGILLAYFPLIWTYSRKSYFALAAVFFVVFLVRGVRKKNLMLVSLFIILGLLLPTRLGERLLDLGEVFTSTDPFHSSWAGNLTMWKESLWNFPHYFLFGSGFGSRHRLFYESHYVQVLSETGGVGFLAFLFLCGTLFREGIAGLARRATEEEKGVALGWLMAFTGILVHSVSCVSFTVSKIAIPFWFLTAVVLASLKRLRKVRP